MNRYEDTMILIKFVPWHFFSRPCPPHPHPFLLLYNPPEFQFCLIFILNIILTSGPSQHIFPPQFVFLFLEITIHHCILVFLNLSFAAKVNFLSKGDATVIHAARTSQSAFEVTSLVFIWLIKNYINWKNLTQLSLWNNISNQLTLLII